MESWFLVKISVIIPVFNVENYLAKCLDSVINQTLKEIEIICVDDGSTDNSFNILNEYKNSDDRIQVYQQENGGHSAATNTALKYIEGDYIFFLDSDDWIELDALEKLYNNATQNNSDLVLYDSIEHLPQNQFRERRFYILNDLKDESNETKVEKTKAWIKANCKYTDKVMNMWDECLYGCLVYGKATCLGYAQGFYYMMKKLHVPCEIEFNSYHAWNKVLVDGEWITVDLTK